MSAATTRTRAVLRAFTVGDASTIDGADWVRLVARVEATLSQTFGADWSRGIGKRCQHAGGARDRAAWSAGERHQAADPNPDGRLRAGGDRLQPGTQTDWRSARSTIRRPGRHQVRLQHPRLRLSQ